MSEIILSALAASTTAALRGESMMTIDPNTTIGKTDDGIQNSDGIQKPARVRRPRAAYKPTEKIYTGLFEIAETCASFRVNVLRISQEEMARELNIPPKLIDTFERDSGRVSMLSCYYHMANKYQRTIFLQKLGEAFEKAGKPKSTKVQDYNAQKKAANS